MCLETIDAMIDRCNDGSILLSDGVMDMSVYLDNSATLCRKRERSSIIASNEQRFDCDFDFLSRLFSSLIPLAVVFKRVSVILKSSRNNVKSSNLDRGFLQLEIHDPFPP
jgi:hypothetical protein